MTEEKQDDIYVRLVREYREILAELAACSAELKWIGENFKALGADMIDPAETLVIDQVSFDADAAITQGCWLNTGRQESRQAGRA
jgi:hypothetical protein